MEISQAEVQRYGNSYSEAGLWSKITGNVKKVGATLLYEVLQLFYVA